MGILIGSLTEKFLKLSPPKAAISECPSQYQLFNQISLPVYSWN